MDFAREGLARVVVDWEGVVVDVLVSVGGATGRRRRASFVVDIANGTARIAVEKMVASISRCVPHYRHLL